MVVLGGSEESSDKVVYLDMWNMEWNSYTPITKRNIPNPDHAASCVVVSKERQSIFNKNKLYGICSVLGLSSDKDSQNSIKEGVYLFGGVENSKFSNDLWQLSIGRKEQFMKIVKTKGITPCPRIHATIEYCKETGNLVLHGGQDELFGRSLKDLYLFDLRMDTWIFVNIRDEYPIGRHEHLATVLSDRFFVFGGLNGNSYIGMEIYSINLDAKAKGESKEVYERKNKFIETKYKIRPKLYQNLIGKFRKADKKHAEKFLKKLTRAKNQDSDSD